MEAGVTDNSRTLDTRVVKELNAIASAFRESGLEIFLFGSIAKTFPRAARGADLDVGMRTEPNLTTDLRDSLKASARSRLELLPTIRPIDVVDFDLVSQRFKELAASSRLEFPLKLDGTYNKGKF